MDSQYPGSIRKILAISILLAVVFSAGCVEGIPGLGQDVEYPKIVPDTQAGLKAIRIVHSFPYQDQEVSLSVPIDLEVYWGARNSRKSAVLYGNQTQEEWLPGYYHAFIEDPTQEPLYDALLGELRRLRFEMNLSDDEYIELIAVFVQSLPYSTDASLAEPKFPVETIRENTGDCDDKSLLLCGLLEREGIGCALFYFEEEKHMAAGVASTDCSYKDTGYAFTETTNYSFVGVPTLEFESGGELESDPFVIPVGDGEGAYGLCRETQEIISAARSAHEKADQISAAVKEKKTAIESEKTAIEALKTETLRKGDRASVEAYNSRVDAYNKMTADYNALAGVYERYADLYNFIATHEYDRPGAGAYLEEWKLSYGPIQG